MKNNFSIIYCMVLLLAVVSDPAFAQKKEKKVDPKHQNIFKDGKIETEEVLIELVDANAQMEFCKMKVKITNKTNDYIIYKPNETEFVFDFGTFNPKAGMTAITGKIEIIEPKGSGSRVITASGDNRFHVEEVNINLKGFYRLSSNGKVFEAPDFNLPASTNDFSAGPFKVLMTNISKETQQTSVRFKVSYANDSKHYGLVQQGRVVCKIESGQEYAMVNTKDKTVVLADGEDDKFNVYYQIPAKVTDMQFANLKLVWKDSFMESEAVPMKLEPVKLLIDPGKTAAKN